ncbi:MAG: NAD(P)-dependent oxidoreductase [Patescibacteria group bacterium]|nr:NAD(P)-dependent oxidoreductase [Patescibacteria group bacterium]MDE2015263.1 NAD(P)-dependent oxidoreductase [Patescibacteria group bacterium]MDE2227069.1 NAD(P)-dependent oxidoreductase [Patescibacteria group bacterium]
MKIFITGGTGFVGRPIVRLFLRAGHSVIVLTRDTRRAADIFTHNRKLRFIKGDLSIPTILKSKIKKFKPDVCVHLAWAGIPDYGIDMSLKNMKEGINLLRILSEIGCKRIVCSGSCWEYGPASTGKFKEDLGLFPSTPFTAAKTAVHWFGKDIAKNVGIEFVWARIFFVYGPGQKSLSLIPQLVKRKNNGLVSKLNNPLGGNDFVYVEDVARAFYKLATLRLRSQYELYNIGSGKMISNARIANIVYGNRVLREPGRPVGFCADISKIKKDTGWRPRFNIVRGVRLTITGNNKL